MSGAKKKNIAEIRTLDMKEGGGHLDPAERNNQIMFQEKLRRLIRHDEIKWKQCSRNKWLKEGDHNTSFFHAAASARRRVNRIFAIESRGRH